MSLNRYACCREMIGDPHGSSCGGSKRYPLGEERASADRYAERIGRELDERARSQEVRA